MKQVIVMRRDLKMRRGKEIAQGAHASMAFMTRRIKSGERFTPEQEIWMRESFTKICVRVDSEEDLLKINMMAKGMLLEVHLITDSGKTEFGGVPTHTCLAIGPDEEEKIDQITGHLTLL